LDSRDAETPGAALAGWQQRFLAFVPSKRLIVPELLEHTDDSNPVVDTGCGSRSSAARSPAVACSLADTRVGSPCGG
jgi:hypothetical protein